MEHHFNVELASKYGVNEAIFCHNLYFWVKQNKANKRNFHKGTYWTYNSMDAYAELFPYWTRRQIEHLIKKCKDKGLIITDNFNKISYDRTLWYAVTENVICIYENCEMEKTNLQNGITENVTPIPDSKPDSKTNNKLEEEEAPQSELISFLLSKDITLANARKFETRLLEKNITGYTNEDILEALTRSFNDFNNNICDEPYLWAVGKLERILDSKTKGKVEKPSRKQKKVTRKELLPDWYEPSEKRKEQDDKFNALLKEKLDNQPRGEMSPKGIEKAKQEIDDMLKKLRGDKHEQ